MKSNGGVISAREVASQPITTMLSGPAAGALGAALLAHTAGYPRVLTLDGGGTSTDVAVVEAGVPHLTTEGRVGRFPVKVPMIDVATVGAGGGSIAWLAQDGRLRVGPRSAGAEPGPMCYGRGGQQPTVTDATLVLDRIPPHLLGGEIPLDRDLARDWHRGVGEITRPERGRDRGRHPGDRRLEPGQRRAPGDRQTRPGRARLRAGRFRRLGAAAGRSTGRRARMRAALVPPSPGNVSAFGLLTVDLKNDYVTTAVQRDDRLDFERAGGCAGSGGAGAPALRREGFPERRCGWCAAPTCAISGKRRRCASRCPRAVLDRASADVAVDRFHAAHERTFGYSYRGQQPAQTIEWVNLRVTGIGPIERPPLADANWNQ